MNYILNTPSDYDSDCRTNRILQNSTSFPFHQSLEEYNCPELISLNYLSNSIGVGNILIKDESNRFGLNAFKVLGASYAIRRLLKEQSNIKTVCTATDGNHGRAVAWVAKKYNLKCVIYVPNDTTKERIDAISKFGASVHKINDNYENTCNYAKQMCVLNNWTLVQDTSFDGYEYIPSLIMSGYLTHMHEINDQIKLMNKSIDIVFLQCGVGSWPASCIWFFRNLFNLNTPKIVLVEPKESAGVFESLKIGNRVSPNGLNQTIMAGLNCGIPSKNAWKIIKSGIDAAMIIDDLSCEKAIRTLFNPLKSDKKIVSGESGAAGLAGLLSVLDFDKFKNLKNHLKLDKNSNILLFNTEGATDLKSFNRIIKKDPNYN